MKRYIVFLKAILLLYAFGACKDDFLEEKRDLNGVNEEVFQDPLMAKAYVDYVYFMFLPGNNGNAFTQTQNGVRGAFSDSYTKTTEELAGETNWNKEWAAISISEAHAPEYFGERVPVGGTQNNTWTRIRQVNMFLVNIDKYGMEEGVRNNLKGQMLFWRAWQYFELVKLYGGVPIVLEPQDPISDNPELNQLGRNSSSEVFEQIIRDLDAAIPMLPGKWTGVDYGRITSGAAAALKGRVLLTWASPQFNRNDERERYEAAYAANLQAKKILEDNGFGLFKEGSVASGEAWGKIWSKEAGNPEAVFVFGFNNIVSDQNEKKSGWENAVRPREISGAGSIAPTKQVLDAFPMKDGKMPGKSSYSYSLKTFYKNRDPRFYQTFAYNGSLWPYNENSNFRVWNYSWFADEAQAEKGIPNKYTETKGQSNSGLYVKKATNPKASNSMGDFAYSGTDFIEIRFAEVLLNLAESAIGVDKLGEALGYIKQVRERAGIENKDGAYGLADLSGRDAYFAAVLNERKVEFAYEGKRFWDIRRWMLYNNDFGTLTRLGLEPIEGMRRTGLWIYVKDVEGNKYIGAEDPMLGIDAAPVINRQPEVYPAGIKNFDEYLDYLYDKHFEVVEKDNLEANDEWRFTWYNEYYFFGFPQKILEAAPYLEQTKGWPGLTGGGGAFDPLK